MKKKVINGILNSNKYKNRLKVVKKILLFIEKKRKSKIIFWKLIINFKDYGWKKFYYDQIKHFDFGDFIICHKKKFMFVYIPKNACSTLRLLALNFDGIKVKDWEIEKFTPRKPDGYRRIRINEAREDKYKDYIKLVIYRDPIDRFFSFYKNKILENPEKHYYFYVWNLKPRTLQAVSHLIFDVRGLYKNGLSKNIAFLKNHLKRKSVRQNRHLRKQSDFYRTCDVDYIIPIEKLNDFLAKKFNIKNIKRNNTTKKLKLKVSRRDIKNIKNIYIYKEDYKIKPNWS